MDDLKFKEELNNRIDKVESILKDSFNMMNLMPQKKVIDAMNYSLMCGGKRLRPILMNEVYKLYGGDGEEIKNFMTAIEMIHTYSLIHDDLPAMDNDDLRRGKPTNHKVYGEDIAILAGDGLLNRAYEVCIDAFAVARERRYVVQALAILANKAGVLGMVGGQVLDLENENKEMPAISEIEANKKRLEETSNLKTGALIEGSMMIGAILGGATMGEVKRMELIGRKIGLAFQIQDDILDITSDEETLGKPIGSDDENNKMTFPSLLGIEQSKEIVDELMNDALTLLKDAKGNNPFLRELIIHLINRKK